MAVGFGRDAAGEVGVDGQFEGGYCGDLAVVEDSVLLGVDQLGAGDDFHYQYIHAEKQEKRYRHKHTHLNCVKLFHSLPNIIIKYKSAILRPKIRHIAREPLLASQRFVEKEIAERYQQQGEDCEEGGCFFDCLSEHEQDRRNAVEVSETLNQLQPVQKHEEGKQCALTFLSDEYFTWTLQKVYHLDYRSHPQTDHILVKSQIIRQFQVRIWKENRHLKGHLALGANNCNILSVSGCVP